MANTSLVPPKQEPLSKYPEEIVLLDTKNAFGEISFDFYEHDTVRSDSKDFFIISFSANENTPTEENVYLDGSAFIYTNVKEFEHHRRKLNELVHQAIMMQFSSALEMQMYIIRQLPFLFAEVDILDFADLEP